MRIAAVDDDRSHLELIQYTIEAIGHNCRGFEHGRDFMRELRRESFDLLIVDWLMPELTGPDLVLWLRDTAENQMPVLLLASCSDERDIVYGFDCGADDYMRKPIRIGELAARTRGLLRRCYPSQGHRSTQLHGRYRIDRTRRVIELDGQSAGLTDKEFELAWKLFSNVGQILSRRHLVETVWGCGSDSSARTLDTCVWSLRSKLGLKAENGYQLRSVYGIGYRLEKTSEP